MIPVTGNELGILFACGLSGSGKTSLITQANVSDLGYRHLVASRLLEAHGRPITDLSAEEVLENQRELVHILLDQLATNSRSILLDGHLLIETANGPELVPIDVLEPLPLRGVLYFKSSPETVFARRANAKTLRSVVEISSAIDQEQRQAESLAARKRVACCILEEPTLRSLLSAISELNERSGGASRH